MKLPADSRERILIIQPWTRSTGPRTAQGKARVARNGLRHGLNSLEFVLLLRWARSVRAVADAVFRGNR
jgi:hypothetical protein